MFSKIGAAVLLCALAASAVVPPPKSAAPAKSSATVKRWMKSLSLHDEIAQLVFVPFHGAAPNTRSREYRQFVKLIRDTRVGGLILVNWSKNRVTQKAEPYALASFLNRMQRLARLPLLVSGDFERGASMRVANTTEFPHAMAFGATGDPSLSRYEGEITAREARALGVQWLFYPVADVNNNPDNPIINIRSFGEDPQAVSAHVKAFIEGAHSSSKYRVLTTAKHFPGHGDTAVDSHLNLAAVQADREHLEAVELAPFRAAIQAGVDAVMTAHLAVPALGVDDIPATVSPAILTGLLKKQLGFNGLVVTDALEMGAITKRYSAGEAAVKALEAGADVLLMSPDPEAAIKAVMAAVRSGRISRQKIEASVAKVLAAKQAVGLDRRRYVNVDDIAEEINSPEAAERAQEIAERAVTLVRNNGGALPLAHAERTGFLILQEGRYATGGQAFAQEVRRRAPQAQVVMLDPAMPVPVLDEAAQKVQGCDSYVIAAYASVSAYRGDAGLAGGLPGLVDAVLATGKPVTMVAMGNPYLLRNFPKLSAYLATFSTVPPSEIAAVKALFGEIPIRGHLPVSIPGAAKCGEGILLPASASGKMQSPAGVP